MATSFSSAHEKLLLVLLAVVLPGEAVAATVASVTFEPPRGWTRSDERGISTFTAPGLAPGESSSLQVFPGEDASDARGWFERSWAGFKQSYGDPQEVPIAATHSDQGHDTLLVGGSMATASRAFVYVTFFAAHRGTRIQPMLFIASSSALYQKHSLALNGAYNSLVFLPPEELPAAAKASFLTLLSGKPAPVAAAAPPPQPASGSGSLAGRWRSGSVSTVTFYNSATGSFAPPSGTGQAYAFEPNGTYTYAGLAQTSIYNCTTTFFTWTSGRYAVAGNQLTLTETEAMGKFINNCSPSNNSEKKRAPRVEHLSWRLERGPNGPVLVLAQPEKDIGDIEYRPDR